MIIMRMPSQISKRWIVEHIALIDSGDDRGDLRNTLHVLLVAGQSRIIARREQLERQIPVHETVNAGTLGKIHDPLSASSQSLTKPEAAGLHLTFSRNELSVTPS